MKASVSEQEIVSVVFSYMSGSHVLSSGLDSWKHSCWLKNSISCMQ